jgi:hypothetical protein
MQVQIHHSSTPGLVRIFGFFIICHLPRYFVDMPLKSFQLENVGWLQNVVSLFAISSCRVYDDIIASMWSHFSFVMLGTRVLDHYSAMNRVIQNSSLTLVPDLPTPFRRKLIFLSDMQYSVMISHSSSSMDYSPISRLDADTFAEYQSLEQL